jgi:hypothetical protein
MTRRLIHIGEGVVATGFTGAGAGFIIPLESEVTTK